MSIQTRARWIVTGCAAALLSAAPGLMVRNKPGVTTANLPAVGAIAPDFTLADYHGRLHHRSDFRGKKLLLTFLCGCPKCRAMAREWERLHRRQSGLAVVGVASLTPAGIALFRRTSRSTFPILPDPNSQLAACYGSLECPRSWVISESGRVTYTDRPGEDLADVARALRHRLAPGRGHR